MKINVVTVQSGWILQKIAERIVAAGCKLGHEFILSHNPRSDVDANFYCDVTNCFRGKTPTKDIGLFTHVHANDIAHVPEMVKRLDYIFHMAFRYIEMFEAWGYCGSKMGVMTPWEIPPGWQLKEPRLGVFQRGKHEGKGFCFLQHFVAKHTDIARKFHWTFVGNDWEDVTDAMRAADIPCVNRKDSEVNYPHGYEALYDEVDYLLIPSKWEGGPIACLEAMCRGIPVISADVGWCEDFTDLLFQPGSIDGLAGILSSIVGEMEKRREMVSGYSYKMCAENIVKAVECLS